MNFLNAFQGAQCRNAKYNLQDKHNLQVPNTTYKLYIFLPNTTYKLYNFFKFYGKEKIRL